jgi:hypothetical protein
MGVKLYKHLPSKNKKPENFNRFIKEVNLALLSNSISTLEEFLHNENAKSPRRNSLVLNTVHGKVQTVGYTVS